MTKVAYNNCFGGFGLSYAGTMRYAELAGIKLYGFVSAHTPDGGIDFDNYVPVTADALDEGNFLCIHYRTKPSMDDGAAGENTYWSDRDISRTDPHLIRVIEEMGDAAGGQCSSLAIEELPPGTFYRIDEYDGNESVMKQSDYAWETA